LYLATGVFYKTEDLIVSGRITADNIIKT